MREWWRWWRAVPARGSYLADARPNPGRPSTSATATAGAVIVAVALDRVLREPPLPVHPVRIIGNYLDGAARMVPAGPPGRARLTGGLAWTTGAAMALVSGLAAERAVRSTPAWCRAALLGTMLWPLFAHRLLLAEAEAVERALAVDLPAGRAAVGRIVSRDVSGLSEAQVRQAAIESLGENLSDSVVAPLFWYAVGGLPAAALYRFANTADAVWGYRTFRWRDAGTVAARADDVLNLVPARWTGLALAWPRVPFRTLRAEARRTPSPNAGWPMAALALRLGIRLEKPGEYMLGAGGRDASAADAVAAIRLARRRGWAAAAVASGAAGARTRRGKGRP